jgi:putative redox protein
MAATVVEVAGLRLAAHLAFPPTGARVGLPGVVVVPGYPSGGDRGYSAATTHPSLADRIADEMGWVALALNPRGTGGSQGNFSLAGWHEDILGAVDYLTRHSRANGVWLAGFGTGGALSICAGAQDLRVRGVAALGSPADFDDWASHPKRLIEHSRVVGIIRDADYPPSIDEWAKGLVELRAVQQAVDLAPRALLLVHGSEDQLVPEADARAIADAHGTADLRVFQGAGHNLRQDPRAVAVLLGWLDRQRRKVPF